MKYVFLAILLITNITLCNALEDASNNDSSPDKILLTKKLEQLTSLAHGEKLGIAAESLSLSINQDKLQENASAMGKPNKAMKVALEKLKSSAIEGGHNYSNKSFQCKQDYDICEPKTQSWRTGPWLCEIAFTTCLSECLIGAMK